MQCHKKMDHRRDMCYDDYLWKFQEEEMNLHFDLLKHVHLNFDMQTWDVNWSSWFAIVNRMRHISVQPKYQELYVVLEVTTIGPQKFLMIFIYEVDRTLSCLSDLVSQYACHVFLFNFLRSLSFQYVSDIVYYEWLQPLPVDWYASRVNVTKCQFVVNVLGATTKHVSPRQLAYITRTCPM